MKSKSLWLLGFYAAAMLHSCQTAAAEPWRVADQPDLKQALADAPVLATESLGEPARGVNVWERWMVPNLDGKSWDVLQIYFKEYYGPTWLFAVDLGTGQVRKQRLADDHQFYLSGRALGFDGKYYIACPSRKTGNMDLFVYDPATNSLEERGEIVRGLSGEVRPLVVGPDGRIYGTGSRENRLGLYIYDPKLKKVVKDFGPVGPSHPNGAWSRYVMGVDDTHAYIASGMIPAWYLVAVNLETGQQKVLLESPTERVMDILESFPSAYARVPQEGGAPDKEYWLYHGEAIPKAGDTPPWPKQPSPWDKAVPKPEVYYDQIDPDLEGRATLWHRSRADARAEDKLPPGAAAGKKPEELGWKAIRLEGAEIYPHRINPLAVLPDGRLFGTGDDYVGSFLFDPATNKATYCGPRTGLAPYTTIVSGGKLYLSGYSGGHLFVFDPARQFTLGKGGPPGDPAPDQGDARSNPRYLGDFDRTTRVGLMHSSALGADGKIYFGGFGLRHYTGGGLGWYDPKTRKMDGLWKPLSGYAVHWITAALEGRAIVISTSRAADELNQNQAPPEAKLFVYDVAAGKIVREIVPVAKGRSTGLIAEVSPGRLLGLTTEREHAEQSILYGVDVASGEVRFRKVLPLPVSTDPYWPHWVDPSYEYETLTRGPDGFIWTNLKDVLVRIDPADASVHVVGKISPVGYPTFVGQDLYLSGSEQLRRIRNLVPPAPGAAQSPAVPTTTTTAARFAGPAVRPVAFQPPARAQAGPSAPIVDDPLAGSTIGKRSGGKFVPGGWQVTGKDDTISWHVPTITCGAAEFDVRGLAPQEGRAGMEDKTEIFHMYDHAAGNADDNYVGGYRDNPFKHFIRKIGALDTAKTDAMEIVWQIRPNCEEPDTARLAWNPEATYRFREEWGPDGAGKSVLKVYRDGVLLSTVTVPGLWNPASHSVRIAASPRRDPAAGAPVGAVFSNLKVWNLGGSANLVRLKGKSLCDDSGPFLGLGVSYFQALRHAKYDRARLNQNLAMFASKGFNYVRVLSMVSWDGLEIAPVTFTNRAGRVVPGWPDYWQQFRDLLDLAARHGLRVEMTIFADAQYVMPKRETRTAHLEGILANIAGREASVVHLEVANEAWQNGFPGPQGVADLRDFAKRLADRTPVLVAITSNDDSSDQGIVSLYRDSAADLATVHFSRDIRTAEGGWLPVRDPYRAGNLPGVPPASSNEPIGPGSSVNSESDPVKLCSAAVFAYLANLPTYVYHSRAGVYGYVRCCPPSGGEDRFEDSAGINAYRHVRRLLPPDLASWTRNDGLEPSAPLTVFANGQPNRYWPDTPGATDGCVRNIGSTKGNQFVCLPMGVRGGGVTLEARQPMRLQVFHPLTGEMVADLAPKAGQRFTLPPGPGAYVCRGSFVEENR